MKDTGRIIAALLIGAAAGAALGLLLAPEKGETLREGIADHINDLVDSAKDAMTTKARDIKKYSSGIYGKAKSKFEGAVDELNEHKDALVDNVREKARDLKNQAQSKLDEGKAHIKNGSNEVNQAIQKS
ncbi:MAG TPA: YtxH domain-containing protein [Mucilaginibacter sp.]|jgi:gas vesicle protein|nr:YtxH domain-containing protein [Mucilaginibacter sp.]